MSDPITEQLQDRMRDMRRDEGGTTDETRQAPGADIVPALLASHKLYSTTLPIPKVRAVIGGRAGSKLAALERREFGRVAHITEMVGYAMRGLQATHTYAVHAADQGHADIMDIVTSRERSDSMNQQIASFAALTIHSLDTKILAALEVYTEKLIEEMTNG